MNDGGPAFPGAEHNMNREDAPVDQWEGMSLRDWFAGMAMQAWLTNNQAVEVLRDKYGDQLPQAVAVVAYEQADALLTIKEQETEDADQGDLPTGGR